MSIRWIPPIHGYQSRLHLLVPGTRPGTGRTIPLDWPEQRIACAGRSTARVIRASVTHSGDIHRSTAYRELSISGSYVAKQKDEFLRSAGRQDTRCLSDVVSQEYSEISARFTILFTGRIVRSRLKFAHPFLTSQPRIGLRHQTGVAPGPLQEVPNEGESRRLCRIIYLSRADFTICGCNISCCGFR